MTRFTTFALVVLLAAGSLVLTVGVSPWWGFAAVPLLAVCLLGVYDVVQREHSILRNYPVAGHMRFLMESIRPEIQQYFIESNTDGEPFDREARSLVYQRAKATEAEEPFGTEREVYATGYEHFVHAMCPLPTPEEPPRVRIGGPECRRPYDMSLLNVSAMSFGSLSSNAILALNTGAARGGFAHDTGEGGLSEYHLRPGGDLIWEIGTGYFGCRTEGGDFDPVMFAAKAAQPSVRCVSLKLSQGAKPGLGGVLPGPKVNAEIAAVRGVPQGKTVISPPSHRVFSTPVELIAFMAQLRELTDGKPVGFKLCVTSRRDMLAICKAMLEVGTAPDFIIVDGSEGGTGAAPLEFLDHIGTPLTEGLITVHNALVGTGLRSRVKIGASGKVSSGSDIVKRLIQGADYTNAARAMMFAVGCIQAQTCHTNTCPVGVATQDPRRARALDVADKSMRVERFQRATVRSATQIMASLGIHNPDELHPGLLRRRIAPTEMRSYAELYDWLEPEELLTDPPAAWATDWKAATPDYF
ncbi:FMN-binding glutamate synthase family protein [Pseudonocardia spinosispora]|uniref:FMN-binding glutamate synthase family protein n=1 Tax=Pseudonocardia spinosispora TaxID=103441 RepID=UPI0003FDA1E0|nr:FMN-binding glutamate synthase family protein [Pseudonocardia spinosispora]